MKLFDDTNIIFSIIKRILLIYQANDSGYYYLVEPFHPAFQNYQELLINYSRNLEWIKRILIFVLKNNIGSHEPYQSLSNFYRWSYRYLNSIQNQTLYSDLPKIDFTNFDNLFVDIALKKEKWKEFRSQLTKQEIAIQEEIEISNFYPKYEPRYVIKKDNMLNKLLDNYDKYYRVEAISDNKDFTQLPSSYHFNPNNDREFMGPNNVSVKFNSKKQHPFQLFSKLINQYGRAVDITVGKNPIDKRNCNKYIYDLRRIISPLGLIIESLGKYHYRIILK